MTAETVLVDLDNLANASSNGEAIITFRGDSLRIRRALGLLISNINSSAIQTSGDNLLIGKEALITHRDIIADVVTQLEGYGIGFQNLGGRVVAERVTGNANDAYATSVANTVQILADIASEKIKLNRPSPSASSQPPATHPSTQSSSLPQ